MANHGCSITACMVVAGILWGRVCPGTENNRPYVVAIQYRRAFLLMIELYSKSLQIAAAGPFAIARSHKRSWTAPERKTMKLIAVPVISGVVLGEVVQRSKLAPHLGGRTNTVHYGVVRKQRFLLSGGRWAL